MSKPMEAACPHCGHGWCPDTTPATKTVSCPNCGARIPREAARTAALEDAAGRATSGS